MMMIIIDCHRLLYDENYHKLLGKEGVLLQKRLANVAVYFKAICFKVVHDA